MLHPGHRWTLGLLFVVVACQRRAPTAKHSATSAPGAGAPAPTLTALTPDTLHLRDGAPTTLIVRGNGFVADSNTVHVGPVTLYGIAGVGNGTILRLIVPDRVQSGVEAPPSLWVSGSYVVFVENSRGRSSTRSVFIQEHR